LPGYRPAGNSATGNVKRRTVCGLYVFFVYSKMLTRGRSVNGRQYKKVQAYPIKKNFGLIYYIGFH